MFFALYLYGLEQKFKFHSNFTHKLHLQYRGQVTEEHMKALKRFNTPCSVILTLRKMKTVLPSPRSDVEKVLRSPVVNKITCSRCLVSHFHVV